MLGLWAPQSQWRGENKLRKDGSMHSPKRGLTGKERGEGGRMLQAVSVNSHSRQLFQGKASKRNYCKGRQENDWPGMKGMDPALSAKRAWRHGSLYIVHLSSVQSLSRVWLFVTPWTAACQASLSITNSWRLPKLMSIESRWCHPTISSSVVSFSSHLQSFPTSGSFPMSQLFASGDQSVGESASTSVLPMNTQDWSPLGWTGWISLQSKGLSSVFSNTTVQKHQFFCAQLSL